MSNGLVCAHRGASYDLPDNSMAAFVAAIAAGSDLIETDVRMTHDGVLVLAHDTWDLEREDLVTLEALLDLTSGSVGLDLEVVELGLERALLDVVSGFPQPLIITSIYPQVLRTVGYLTDSIQTGLVIEAPSDGAPFNGDPFALADACGASVTLVEDALDPDGALATRARDESRAYWVWTVNDRQRLAELFADGGVTGVITDVPARAVEVRARHARSIRHVVP